MFDAASIIRSLVSRRRRRRRRRQEKRIIKNWTVIATTLTASTESVGVGRLMRPRLLLLLLLLFYQSVSQLKSVGSKT